MKVVSIRERFAKAQMQRQPNADADFLGPPESRALVAVSATANNDREPPVSYRPAPFLAQLIAMNAQVPQMRERRRAEPAEAIEIYTRTMTLKPAPKHTLSRTL